METRHKTELKNRMMRANKKWIVSVTNYEEGTKVVTDFSSDKHTFEQVLHNIELNLMTNLNYGFTNPINVEVRELEDVICK